jgi:hypothetical protein
MVFAEMARNCTGVLALRSFFWSVCRVVVAALTMWPAKDVWLVPFEKQHGKALNGSG